MPRCSSLTLVGIYLALFVALAIGIDDHERRVVREADDVIYKYGIVIDAGSSGSRVSVYKWLPRKSKYEVAEIKQIFTAKRKIGLSSKVDDLNKIREDITDLISSALPKVPDDRQSVTPIYVMATAGLRLEDQKANQVIEYINDNIMLDTNINPFEYDPRNTRILSGEEEGVFAWIAVNYLLGVFKQEPNGRHPKTYGILELGGASTQIAFHPEMNSILADKFPVKIAGHRIPLYVHSYLVYGQNQVDMLIKEQLIARSQKGSDITNPCTPKGDERVYGDRKFIGGGNPVECIALLEEHVYKEYDKCYPKPCGIGNVYQAPIPKEQTFYAVGAFVYALREIGALSENNTFQPARGFEAGSAYCLKTISELTEGGTSAEYAAINCLVGLYISVLFTRGYGFSNETDKIIAVQTIKEQPAEWTLGAIIYENELKGWDCSQDPVLAYSRSSAIGTHNRQCIQAYCIGLFVLTLMCTLLGSRFLHDKLI